MDLLRTIFLTALTLVAIPSSALADEAYTNAMSKLEAGDHQAARDDFAAMVEAKRFAPEVFFGLGNSHYRLGDNGAAALAYRRALFLEPSYKEARQNLKFLEDKTGLVDTATPEKPTAKPPRFSTGMIQLGLVGGILIAATGIGLLVGLRRRPAWFSIALFVVAALGATTATTFAVIANKREAAQPPIDGAVVLAPETSAHTAPAESASKIISLPPGSLVKVEAVRGSWSYVDLPGELRGWVPNKLLESLWPFEDE